VVAEHAGDEGRDVEALERLAAARRLEAGLEVRLEVAPALRAHPHRDQPVRHLGAAADAGGADQRGVDRQVLAAVQDALERLAEPRGARAAVRDVVVLAVELERLLAREDLADDLDVLAGAGERLAVRHAVPALDHLWSRGTEAEDEATAR